MMGVCPAGGTFNGAYTVGLLLVQLCVGLVVAVDLEPVVQALAVVLDARHTGIEDGDGAVGDPLAALLDDALELFELVLIGHILRNDAHVGDVHAAVGEVEDIRLGLREVTLEVLADVEFHQGGVVADRGGQDVARLDLVLVGVNADAERIVQTASLQAAKTGGAAAGPDHVAAHVVDHVLGNVLCVCGVGEADGVVDVDLRIGVVEQCALTEAVAVLIEADGLCAEQDADVAALVLADALNKGVAVGRCIGGDDAREEGVLVQGDVGLNDVLRGFGETVDRVDAELTADNDEVDVGVIQCNGVHIAADAGFEVDDQTIEKEPRSILFLSVRPWPLFCILLR